MRPASLGYELGCTAAMTALLAAGDVFLRYSSDEALCQFASMLENGFLLFIIPLCLLTVLELVWRRAGPRSPCPSGFSTSGSTCCTCSRGL